jgi:predicted GIY-YIG superfamily endonuclease
MKGRAEDFFNSWDDFWFRPRTAHTIALIRIAVGAMLAYIHFVWLLRIDDFFGRDALIGNELSRKLHAGDSAWTYLWSVESAAMLRLHQIVAVLAGLAVCLGFLTRLTVPLAWWMTLMVCHRMTGFLFGLDQVVMMLAMYLIPTCSGCLWSVDARLAQSGLLERLPGWKAWLFPSRDPRSSVSLATRLMQIHLCIVYLFGGLAKLRGEMWWDGSAMWFSAAAYEYQSLDLTWLGRFPTVAAIVTHVTIFWETFYCFLIWNRRWRPVMLATAVAVHGGIALFLGMITFGSMMLVANLAFVEPAWISRGVEYFSQRAKQGASKAHSGKLAAFLASAFITVFASVESFAQELTEIKSQSTKSLSSDDYRRIFSEHHDGWSLDEVMLDDDRRQAMLKAFQVHPNGDEEKAHWERLVRLRKSGKLDVESTRRETTDYGDSLPAAEIAARRLQDELSVGFDQILIDPMLLRRYDEIARAIDSDSSIYTLRKAALRLRKSRQLRPELVTRVVDWKREIQTLSLDEAVKTMRQLPTRPGIYIFRDAAGYLYIGQSNNLRERLEKHLTDSDRKNLAAYLREKIGKNIVLELHIFLDGSPAENTAIREAYESELIRTRKPKLNLSP